MIFVMDDIIERIIDIEMKAQSVVKEAQERRLELDGIIDKEIENIKDDMEKQAAQKCDAVSKAEQKAAEKKISEIKDKSRSISEKLENTYAENREQWISSIVENVINS